MLSDADFGKVAGAKATRLDVVEVSRLMEAPSGSRPRVYALWHGQIVRVQSQYHVSEYRADAEAWWLSGTTVADLISRA